MVHFSTPLFSSATVQKSAENHSRWIVITLNSWYFFTLPPAEILYLISRYAVASHTRQAECPLCMKVSV